jgi:negative regulator of sigma E activity
MNENLSSLFDNELENHEIDELLIQLSKQKKSNNWSYYQLIRDVIQKNHLGSNNLTKNIMHAIEKEPTQLVGFTRPKDNSLESKSNYWPIAASFAALFVVGLTALNLTEFKSVDSVVLVEADIPTELINDHHASASSNVNLFIQASYRK